jgi:hypothetical protein
LNRNYIKGNTNKKKLNTPALDNRLTDGGEVFSLAPDRPLPPGRLLVHISVRGRVDPRA